ncbi:hypothetical protein GCM10010156_59850 [Planobispora rosea]|uniref:HTH merR-type domain-containing protein n=1 Tax=Planobispora rosea TaxID=35762 RepID=A0A8J3WFZ7_PLARO|nr:hypothetical protein GCM10010156_59850 [Planobispora rosea]GIH87287.1 hypothetical protein Pro02_56950 [Planobispora rosea]
MGMSPRNIRAHQSRGLLQPPLRRGRVAVYDSGHVRRLEAIKALQRQGYNLAAIEVFLGLRADQDHDALAELVRQLGTARPAILRTLLAHGLVARDGPVLRVLRPKPLRAALGLRDYGLSPLAALQLLAELLDTVSGLAAQLMSDVERRATVLRDPAAAPPPLLAPEDFGLLLAEALRTVTETTARDLVS